MIGKTVDHYRITEKLGEGGMGEVYLAEDTSLKRKVALKFLPAYLEHDETAQKRFIREARSAAAIDHPYIGKIYEVGEIDGKHYIVMEYVQGHTLQEKITQGRIPVKQALKIASETAEAIDRAHQEGIVHRDLKPSNIMLAHDGHVKVMDFGLAKRMEREDEDITAALTREGTTLGTLAYMSPEQLKGKPVDTCSDIFSFGVVLYEMLTGVHPFRTGTQAETVNAILNEHPSPLSRYTEDTSDILQHTVEKMLAKDPDERYQLIHDVGTNLKKLSEKLNVSGVSPAVVKAKRSYWLRVGAGLAVLVAVMLAFYYFQPASVEEVRIDSIAVAPFSSRAEDLESSSLADGIASSISSSLLRLDGIKVKPASVLTRYKGETIEPLTVADEQNVHAVLIGNVIKHGDKLTVDVNLIDGRDNTLIWGQPYNRSVKDIFAVQEDIARQVVGALRIQLTGEESEALGQGVTQNPEAYQSYLRGKHHVETLFVVEEWESVKRAIPFYERAIELDPSYQEAYKELAQSYYDVADRGIDPDGYEKAEYYWNKVVEIDDSTVFALEVKARRLWRVERNWEEADREYRKAVELNPSFEVPGGFLEWMGRREERLAQLAREREQADPLSYNQQVMLGWRLLWSREYDRAIEQARKGLVLEPEGFDPPNILSISYEMKGMDEEAYEATLAGLEKQGASEDELAALKDAYEKAGMKAIHKLDLEKRLNEPRPRLIELAQLSVGIEEWDKVFEWLDKDWSQPLAGYEHAPSNPQFDPIRDDPRFEELLRRQNLPEEAIARHLAPR